MTPEESEQIAGAGAAFFQNISEMMVQSGLFGQRKENNGWQHEGLIAMLLAGLVMAVLSTCASIAFDLILVKFGLVVSLPGGISTQIMAANSESSVADILESWSSSFMFLIADISIVWRAWALHNQQC
ncbi:hypothetical protein BT96DRAFT_982117 [Gymnopus androsaceus JB14]|uniref:Uncharacterized protein n=1 Tax=Gymnopus androsaceus JB14 TaxID=1447944 RepID=A0A6A4GIV4_9AGAR|nr:hypothetical protein BT96DRAFT_982117 [Gymnopus androsaceus JB14]